MSSATDSISRETSLRLRTWYHEDDKIQQVIQVQYSEFAFKPAPYHAQRPFQGYTKIKRGIKVLKEEGKEKKKDKGPR